MDRVVSRRLNNAQVVQALAADGETSKQIAHTTGLSYSYVRDLLTDPAGEGCRRRHEKARRRCEACGELGSWSGRRSTGEQVLCQPCIALVADEKGQEYAALYADGWSTFDIADHFRVRQGSVWESLRRLGIPRRSKAEAVRLAWAKKKEAVQ